MFEFWPFHHLQLIIVVENKNTVCATNMGKLFCVFLAHDLLSTVVILEVPIALCNKTYEPPHVKTNNVVSEQVSHKLGCTSTEDG